MSPRTLCRLLNKYIQSTELPVLADFATRHGISQRKLYSMAAQHEAIADAIARLLDKKEAELELGTLTGKYTATTALHFLKQLGTSEERLPPLPALPSIDLSHLDDEELLQLERQLRAERHL